MSKTIDKQKLTNLIYDRLNSSITKISIYDAISIINTSLVDMILDDKAIFIDNFGTISPYTFHNHKGFNIALGQMQEVKEFKSVKFRVHTTFQMLLEQKKHRFKKT